MTRVLKAEADGDEGWAIFVDKVPIINFNKDGEAPLDLMSGEHSLLYDVRGAGAKLTLDLEGRPPIIVPVGAKWPFKIEVPDHATIAADRLYFVVGE